MPVSQLSLLTHSAEQLDAILSAGSGSLVDTPYPILLLALALREKSAVLELRRNQLQKEIVFDAGAPVECYSNIATETLGRFLLSTGKISEPECNLAQAQATARGVPLEEILTERKLLPPSELYRVLQQSLGRKLLEPFSWKSGTWEISFEVEPVVSALRVKVPQLVLTGILKVENQEVVDDVIASAREQFLSLEEQPLFAPDDIRLSAEQQKVLEAARNGTKISSIASETGIEEDDANRLIYALVLLGVANVTEAAVRAVPHFELDHPFRAKTTEARLPDLVAPPPAAQPKPEPPRPGVEAATAEEVMAAYLSHKRKDAFELLEVTEADGPLQFMRAFLRMADRFLPSKFDERAPDGLRDKAQEIFLSAARAWVELADPVRRDALLASRTKTRELPIPVADGGTREEAPPPPRPSPPDARPAAAPAQPPPPEPRAATPPLSARKTAARTIIDPEELCRNGRALAEAGKLREALSSFELAAECDTQNGTYAAEVAWCRFRLAVSPGATTLKMLKNAIRIDPRSGLANLYAGKVATALGNRTEAANYLNRAAMLMPKDMRVVEALKAIR